MSAPEITIADVQALVTALERSAEQWLTAADLATLLHGTPTESAKRRIRAAASAAGSGVVSYPGSPGYALWTRCSADEIHACIAAWTSQTDEMRRRRDLYRLRLHTGRPHASATATGQLTLL